MSHDAAAGSARGRPAWPVAMAALASLAVIGFLGLPPVDLRLSSLRGVKTDYYNELVHGFRSGHLYMDMGKGSPYSSGDPAVIAKLQKPLDTSYWKGRFYLYFGVVPAAFVLLPYSVLTGGDLNPQLLVAPAVAAGFLFSLASWRLVVGRSRQKGRTVYEIGATLALGLSTAALQLLTRQMFYELAIACGYACISAGAYWACRAALRRGRPHLRLALSSLALGLAVGCRPNLVVALPAVAMAALFSSRAGSAGAQRPRLCGALACAIGPAAVVGALLALYNFERFGNPLEFGFSYGQNRFLNSHLPFAGMSFFLANARWDYLTPPSLSPYFPFVFPEAASFRPPHFFGDEVMHGQFPFTIVAAFVAFSAVLVWRRGAHGRIGCFWILGWLFAAPFAAESALTLRADRYMVDFNPMLVLLTVSAAGVVCDALAPRAAGAWAWAFAALAAAASAFNFFAGIEEFSVFKDTRHVAYPAMERAGNIPSQWLASMGVLKRGPVRFKVTFPVVKRARTEPLLTIGTPERTDSVYAIVHENNFVELLGTHTGGPERRSGLIPVVPGRSYEIKVDMGAFYPPVGDPYFSGIGPVQAQIVKSRYRVWMDGRMVVNDRMNCYDSASWTLELGRNDRSLTPFGRAFTGAIGGLERLPPPAAEPIRPVNGLWKVRCEILGSMVGGAFPLLALGQTGNGTLLFVRVNSTSELTLGIDEWGYGGAVSGAISLRPGAEHEFEIFVGPLVAQADWQKEWGMGLSPMGANADRLRVWMDGVPVWEAPLRRPLETLDPFAEVGANFQGFSSAQQAYPTGAFHVEEMGKAEACSFVARNIGEIK